jgi:hypothetical protein
MVAAQVIGILEREVVEAVAPPEHLDLLAHPRRLEPDPFALVDERIGAEGAAEIAALRRDIIELALAFERVVALDRQQAIVVGAEGIDVAKRAGRVGVRMAVGRTIGAAKTAIQGLATFQAIQDLSKGFFALRLHGDVDARLIQALTAEHRGMPAAPDYGQIRPVGLGRARYLHRVADRIPRQHADAEAQRVIQVSKHGMLWVVFQPSIDDHDLIARRIEIGADREQAQRHSEEDSARIIQHDLPARAALSLRGGHVQCNFFEHRFVLNH